MSVEATPFLETSFETEPQTATASSECRQPGIMHAAQHTTHRRLRLQSSAPRMDLSDCDERWAAAFGSYPPWQGQHLVAVDTFVERLYDVPVDAVHFVCLIYTTNTSSDRMNGCRGFSTPLLPEAPI